MNEFEFIKKIKDIKKNHDIVLGIGDDAAIDGNKLICSDTLVENIHFSFDYFTLKDVIKKAIKVNLSDILAMNGKPLYYLLNISLPKSQTSKLDLITDALREINEEYDIDVIGGDTTSSSRDVFVSVTLIGKSDNPILRSGAEEGDYIYICGFPGKSALALKLLQKGIDKDKFEECYKSHVSPDINFKYLELFRKIKINSMIDISDGLLSDLTHILKASQKGAVLEEELFYDNLDFSSLAEYYELNPMDLIYNGGEDFFPLFTSPAAPKDIYLISEELGLNVYHIGKVIKGKGIVNKFNTELKPEGFLHF